MKFNISLIEKCNHVNSDTQKKYGFIELTRISSDNALERISSKYSILRLDEIRNSENVLLLKNKDYLISTSLDSIQWINNKKNVPSVGDTYKIKCLYYQTDTLKSTKDCSLCEGNGWYVSIFNGLKDVRKSSSGESLTQLVIQAVFGSNSKIQDVLGGNVYNELFVENEIRTFISELDSSIKAVQQKSIDDGCTLDDADLLASLSIDKLYFAEEETTYIIILKILSVSGKSYSFGFKA